MSGDEEIPWAGQVVITWPTGLGWGKILLEQVLLTNAATGLPLAATCDMRICGDFNRPLSAEITMLCDREGRPLLLSGTVKTVEPQVDDNGDILKRRFRWDIVEMRVTL